jgi:hypothetical protein
VVLQSDETVGNGLHLFPGRGLPGLADDLPPGVIGELCKMEQSLFALRQYHQKAGGEIIHANHLKGSLPPREGIIPYKIFTDADVSGVDTAWEGSKKT